MKSLIVLLFLLSSISLIAQENEERNFLTKLNFGILGGANYSDATGVSFIIEGKTNLTSNLNFKFSLGYVESYQNDFQSVKSYKYYSFFNKYQSYSFNRDKIEYEIVPLSIGLEYVITHNKFSPYCFIEGGYNYYNSKVYTSALTYKDYYNNYYEIPADYRNIPPVIYDGNKTRLGLGVGTQMQLIGKLNLDVRYMYQFNTGLINTHQLLFGFAY